MQASRLSVLALSCLSFALPAAAQDGELPSQTRLQFRAPVVVGDNGQGQVADSFPTTVAGEEVHYFLVVENGCGPSGGGVPCAPPVDALSVTLNQTVVLDEQGPFTHERRPVALNALGAGNDILATASGAPGSAVRVAVLAVRPLPVIIGGRSILPFAAISGNVKVAMVVHNAGPANIAFRLQLFNPDGSSAGLSDPHVLPGHATVSLDLATIAGALGSSWTRGSVHVRWASRGHARLSSVARELRTAPDASNVLRIIGVQELALDDWGPHPLGPDEAAQFPLP
jgi:hypothetical protein